VLSTGAYVGYTILFNLPGIGWIICLIMAFASKNLNCKNYARAVLIFLIISFVLGIIIGVGCFFYFRDLALQFQNGMNYGGGEFLQELLQNIQ